MPSINVDLGSRGYPIAIKAGSLTDTGFLASAIVGKTAVIITNETIAPLYLQGIQALLDSLDKTCHSIVLPDGEKFKTLDTFQDVMGQLLEKRISRDSCIVALGGGVIGDLSGFVAACYQRGIDFVQVPTTLLSQVDSSVGGKTAVNHPLGKNMIGAFYQPKAVLIDPETLNTLPSEEFSAGMAEVIKYGIIYDGEFFDWLENNQLALLNKEPDALEYTVSKCCEIKADIVRQDEKEHGLRALLNLGHTFGHAIEAELGYGAWLHGEAVAAGTVIACKLAIARNQFTQEQLSRVIDIFRFFKLPIEGPATMSAEDYINHMSRDKKVLSGTMRFILPKGIGEAEVVSDVSEKELYELLN